ncbi:MAG: hypothetical protein EOO38_22330, partial [Cytophagaceae bacterium]
MLNNDLQENEPWRVLVHRVLAAADGPLPVAAIIRQVGDLRQTGQHPDRTIRTALIAHPDLFERTGKGIYQLKRAELTGSFDMQPHKILKVAPGEGGSLWDECHDGDYICIGWDELGDLSVYETKEEFLQGTLEKLKELYPVSSKRSAKANEIWKFRTLK